jgi:hypothetical protein
MPSREQGVAQTILDMQEPDRLRELLERTLPVLSAAATGVPCSMAAGDLYRDILAATKTSK